MDYNYKTKTICPICGKPDGCGSGQGQNGLIAYCMRIKMTKGTVVEGADGNQWIAIRPDGNMYCGYGLKSNEDEAKERNRQAWIEEQKRNNPNWHTYSKGSSKNPTKVVNYKEINPEFKDRSGYKRDLVEATTDSSKLNRVYMALLSCLVLEPEHEASLKKEWGDELFATLTSLYPIKSLPMADAERYSYGAFRQSPWRKAIINQMLTLGITKEDMIGVPGFYENSKGEMTLYRLSGIVFPVYDGKGNIVRIRIKDDFPSAKGTFQGKEGHFYFSSKDAGWYFQADNEAPILVYQPKSKTYKVKLDGGSTGVPLSDNGKSKIEGKYKNFSSCKELVDDEKKTITNYFKNGAQSGSFPSIYTQDGDNTSIVFFTEGEKKAMVANKLLGCPVVCFPGVGTFKKAFESLTDSGSIMDALIAKGMKKAVLAYDADKTSNVHVLQAEKNCVQWFLNHKIAMAIGEWDPRYGKGLDDVLLKGIRPILYDIK